MLRRIALSFAALLLSGCVTYPTYTYDDGREVTYVDDDTYYVEAGNGYGDYYASDEIYDDPWRYSAYYSLYWPIHRLYWDSYWYPDFYYGVTYFPRDYFHVGWGGIWRPYRPYWGYQHWYAPYRHSWVDNHYAWYWHRGRQQAPTYQPMPRFGHARNEAERLNWYQQNAASARASRADQRIDTTGRAGSGSHRNTPSREASYGARGATNASARLGSQPATPPRSLDRPSRSAQPYPAMTPRPSADAATLRYPEPAMRSNTGRPARPTESFTLPSSPRPSRAAQFERAETPRAMRSVNPAFESTPRATSDAPAERVRSMPSPSPRYAPAPRAEPSFRSEPARAPAPISRAESSARGAVRSARDAQDEQ